MLERQLRQSRDVVNSKGAATLATARTPATEGTLATAGAEVAKNSRRHFEGANSHKKISNTRVNFNTNTTETETPATAWMMASAGTPETEGTPARVLSTAEVLAPPWMPATAGTLPKEGVSQIATRK